MFKPVIIIPFFNHGAAFEKTAVQLKNIKHPNNNKGDNDNEQN